MSLLPATKQRPAESASHAEQNSLQAALLVCSFEKSVNSSVETGLSSLLGLSAKPALRDQSKQDVAKSKLTPRSSRNVSPPSFTSMGKSSACPTSKEVMNQSHTPLDSHLRRATHWAWPLQRFRQMFSTFHTNTLHMARGGTCRQGTDQARHYVFTRALTPRPFARTRQAHKTLKSCTSLHENKGLELITVNE